MRQGGHQANSQPLSRVARELFDDYLVHDVARQRYQKTVRYATLVAVFLSAALTSTGLAHASQGDGTADDFDKSLEYTEFSIWAIYSILLVYCVYKYTVADQACQAIERNRRPAAMQCLEVIGIFWDESREAFGLTEFRQILKPISNVLGFFLEIDYFSKTSLTVETLTLTTCLTLSLMAMHGDLSLNPDPATNDAAIFILLSIGIVAGIPPFLKFLKAWGNAHTEQDVYKWLGGFMSAILLSSPGCALSYVVYMGFTNQWNIPGMVHEAEYMLFFIVGIYAFAFILPLLAFLTATVFHECKLALESAQECGRSICNGY